MHLAMAQAGGVADVLRAVRHGVPPESGNAGAMPLDYLLLHAWLSVTPAPAPEHLEIHFRLPAFASSVAALVAFAVFASRHLDRDAGAIATLLLAVSMPHVLYAAEARWYALLALLTIGHLWAFARLLERPAAPRRWLGWFVVAIASVLTAVLSIIPLGAELIVLAVRAGRSRRALVGLGASAATLAVLVAWLAAPSLGVTYGRPSAARPGLVATAWQVLGFLAWDDLTLLAGLAVGPFAAWWWAGPEPGRRRALVAALVLSFVAIPVVTALADAKAYYVHPRHVVFLLPGFVILVAFGLVGVGRALVGERWGVVAAAALVVVTQLPTMVRYVTAPDVFFARTKTLRDVRGIVAAVATASQGMPPGARWLLLAERQSVPNAVVDRYLRWWRLDDRVVFRGTRDVPAALGLLADPTTPLERLGAPPVATIPVGLTDQLRAFLGIAADTAPRVSPLAGASIVTWDADPRVEGLAPRVLTGARLFERRSAGTAHRGRSPLPGVAPPRDGD